jgi:8-oxo-dGTP pyrophosphatase MutT (NUDIX family)
VNAKSADPIQAYFSIAVLQDARERILLIKRASNAAIGPRLWGLPAGHIESDESPLRCIHREMNEELGAEHTLKLLTQLEPVRDTQYGGIYEIHLFHFRWLSGRIQLNAEHTDYAWVSREHYHYAHYQTVPGVDEDLSLLRIWLECL